MVKHVVMFKLKEKNQKNLDFAVSTLSNLEGKIETLRFVEIGLDFQNSDRSYDIVLTTHFEDKAGFDAYKGHPNHLPVIDEMRKLCSSSVVVDYITE